ncbi:hypothetical protein GCM10009839_68120 [Catenulispora yoronensis]|uniref:TROVE domain-containing protein n=1 Tax=Catenulispora yoronensis TaxID=450799 RepID=A0ABP5GMN8_9ACTN
MGMAADLVAAEDVLLFVNAATASTGQREFYDTADEQAMSLEFLHEYMLYNYRDLYAASLALGINDHNALMAIRGLLETARNATPGQKATEGTLIARRLLTLPPPRVFRLFKDLRRHGVNNRRTRAIVRDWIKGLESPAYHAVKYRSGFKAGLKHAHIDIGDGELRDFLFGPLAHKPYTTPILETWRQAHYTSSALYKLPYTVAEGFAAKHGIDREVFLARISDRMTPLEKLRTGEDPVDPLALLNESAKYHGPQQIPWLTRLAVRVLALPLDERAARRAELTEGLRRFAAVEAGELAGTWGRVTAVLDDSFSSFGSPVKRRRPLAVALACHFLLEALAAPGQYTPLWMSGRKDPLLTYPGGPTPLGLRLIDALETGPDRIVVVSDGWDNSPPGLAGEVLRVWRARLDPEQRVDVVHVNPVFDADTLDVRALSPDAPSVGIRDAEDLVSLVELAQFAQGLLGLPELMAYLDGRVRRYLGAH